MLPPLVAALVAGACAAGYGVQVVPAESRTCGVAVAPDGAASGDSIRWIRPERGRDRDRLDAWCAAVGPAVIAPAPLAAAADADELVIVSWNVNVGGGDLQGLVEQLQSGELTGGKPIRNVVLLLQEAYRSGPLVPAVPRAGARMPRSIQPGPAGGRGPDIVQTAAASGLALYYVPSMRNGRPHQSDEDRGNAILSTLPLSDFAAVELPFERQRRVAVEATVWVPASGDRAWPLRVTSAHLDNLGPARRLWIFADAARLRQARGLLGGIAAGGPAVLGGDFNTWFGTREPTYRELAARYTHDSASARGPTFGGLLRLDHLLLRLPEGWDVEFARLGRFGSDHNVLIARVRSG